MNEIALIVGRLQLSLPYLGGETIQASGKGSDLNDSCTSRSNYFKRPCEYGTVKDFASLGHKRRKRRFVAMMSVNEAIG